MKQLELDTQYSTYVYPDQTQWFEEICRIADFIEGYGILGVVRVWDDVYSVFSIQESQAFRYIHDELEPNRWVPIADQSSQELITPETLSSAIAIVDHYKRGNHAW